MTANTAAITAYGANLEDTTNSRQPPQACRKEETQRHAENADDGKFSEWIDTDLHECVLQANHHRQNVYHVCAEGVLRQRAQPARTAGHVLSEQHRQADAQANADERFPDAPEHRIRRVEIPADAQSDTDRKPEHARSCRQVTDPSAAC